MACVFPWSSKNELEPLKILLLCIAFEDGRVTSNKSIINWSVFAFGSLMLASLASSISVVTLLPSARWLVTPSLSGRLA